ncbi:MAG: CinA family protein [Acidibrevibacterium sp.]|jgi:nicotinamide-nucleotide amidase|uniref:CinA family protein n=1 Tax=Acidibrevibacterium fodinaquatile TaxID=1969806 RepID=UPI000E0D2260|nr:CinA family protein [Acidibrevibacterium fodinaquatile]MCA7121065.1 CinA family protein [Acidibrevibacterium fodinaquatile]
MVPEEDEYRAAEALLGRLRARGLRLATAESCTGGLVAALITAIPGASDVFGHGFVTYANEAKIDLLGVPAALLAAHGAVSEAVARAMAAGALARAAAGVALAITGIAGPGGGSAEKPVGLVWFGLARAGEVRALSRKFLGSRNEIRAAATREAINQLQDFLN